MTEAVVAICYNVPEKLCEIRKAAKAKIRLQLWVYWLGLVLKVRG